MKWTSFARSFHTPTQAPWAPSFGYRNLVSSEPSFVYRGLLKSPISAVTRVLALLLLVLRVLADNHNLALAADDLALLADRLYRRSYLHDILPPSIFSECRTTYITVILLPKFRHALPKASPIHKVLAAFLALPDRNLFKQPHPLISAASFHFWWDGTPASRRPLALGSHTRLRPLFCYLERQVIRPRVRS